jgi:hypothetical protein
VLARLGVQRVHVLVVRADVDGPADDRRLGLHAVARLELQMRSPPVADGVDLVDGALDSSEVREAPPTRASVGTTGAAPAARSNARRFSSRPVIPATPSGDVSSVAYPITAARSDICIGCTNFTVCTRGGTVQRAHGPGRHRDAGTPGEPVDLTREPTAIGADPS